MRIAAALLSLLPSVACQAQIPAESLTLGATHESEPVVRREERHSGLERADVLFEIRIIGGDLRWVRHD